MILYVKFVAMAISSKTNSVEESPLDHHRRIGLATPPRSPASETPILLEQADE